MKISMPRPIKSKGEGEIEGILGRTKEVYQHKHGRVGKFAISLGIARNLLMVIVWILWGMVGRSSCWF